MILVLHLVAYLVLYLVEHFFDAIEIINKTLRVYFVYSGNIKNSGVFRESADDISVPCECGLDAFLKGPVMLNILSKICLKILVHNRKWL